MGVLVAVMTRSAVSLGEIEKGMQQASTYADWLELAQLHDRQSGAVIWQATPETTLYDYREISARHAKLSTSLQEGQADELLYALNEGVHGNMGGMGRPVLYSQAYCGTKQLIDDYVASISTALDFIHRCPEDKISRAEKIDFFRRASHCYGRSALLLSGGAGLIYFHHGVVQELIDHDLLPRVISGSSAGAIVAAQLGMMDDDELRSGYFETKRYHQPTRTRVLDAMRGRVSAAEVKMVREQVLDEVIARDMTFQDAFEKTGRYINISVSPAEKHQLSRLMNAITSPNVYIRSAISASIAIPGMLPPERLYARGFDGSPRPYLEGRRWVDGSLSSDLPAKRMARLYGVNHFIVSMINPVVVPFVEDVKTRQVRGVRSVFSESTVRVAGEMLVMLERMLARRGEKGRALAAQLSYLIAMLDQSYLGDINIMIANKDFRWMHALYDYAPGDVERLIVAGRRRTWPKLSMIRNAALISRTLDRILEELDMMTGVHAPHGRLPK